MQQLKYVRPNGNPENIDDCVVLKFAEPYILETLEGVSGCEKTIVASEIAGVDGVAVHHIRAEPRVIPTTAYVYGNTREEMYKNRLKLISILSDTKQAGTLYYINDHITVMIEAYPQIPGNFKERIKNYNKCSIEFFCPYPYWSATEQQALQMSYDIQEDAFSFPLVFDDTVCFAENRTTATIDYNGSVPTPVTLTLIGNVLSPVIKNETTGEQIEVADVELTENDTLTINTKKGAKSVTLYKDGMTSSAFNLVTASSVFWQLQPGKNVISLTSLKGVTASTLIIAYVNMYGGV
ncbi:MAG: phage tail family protein [Acutalibacteraceae bacterium]|nr:phage tail family protein [Acutalibacteraceae bacterium]